MSGTGVPSASAVHGLANGTPTDARRLEQRADRSAWRPSVYVVQSGSSYSLMYVDKSCVDGRPAYQLATIPLVMSL
jgi:hypothetical protein